MVTAEKMLMVMGTAAVRKISRTNFFSSDDQRNLDLLAQHLLQLLLQSFFLWSARSITVNRFIGRWWNFYDAIHFNFLLSELMVEI